MITKCLQVLISFVLFVGCQSVAVLPSDAAVNVVVTSEGSAGKLLMPQPVFSVSSPSQGVVQLSNGSTAGMKLLSGPGMIQGTLVTTVDGQNQFKYYDITATSPGTYLVQIIITIPGISSLVKEISLAVRQVFPTTTRLVTDKGIIGTPNNKLIPQPMLMLVDDIGVASPALTPFFKEVYCIIATVSPLLTLKRGDTRSNVSADGVRFEFADLGIDLVGYHELTASVTLVLASGHTYTLSVDNFFVNITKNRAYPTGAVSESPPFGIVNQYLSNKISIRLLGVPDEAKASISLLSGQGKQLDGSITNVHVDETKTRITFNDVIPRVVGVYDIQVIVTLSNGIVYTVPIQFSVAPSENQPDCVCVLQHGSGRIGIPLFNIPIIALSSGCLSGSCSASNHLLVIKNSTSSISGTNINGLVVGNQDPTGRFFFHNLTFPAEGNFQLTATVVVGANSFSVPIFIDISQAIGSASQVVTIQKLSRASDFGEILSPHPEVELLAEGGYPPPADNYQIVANLRELNYGAAMTYLMIRGTDSVGYRFVFENTTIQKQPNGSPPQGLYHIDVLVILPGGRGSLRTSIPVLISGAISRPARILSNFKTEYETPLSGECRYNPYSVSVVNNSKELTLAKEMFPNLNNKIVNSSTSCQPSDQISPVEGGEYFISTSLHLDDGTVLSGEETICVQGQVSQCGGPSNSYLITLLTVIVGFLLLIICYLITVIRDAGISLTDLKKKTLPRVQRSSASAVSQQQTRMLEPLLNKTQRSPTNNISRVQTSIPHNEEYSSEEEEGEECEEEEEFEEEEEEDELPINKGYLTSQYPMVQFAGNQRTSRGNTILPSSNKKNPPAAPIQHIQQTLPSDSSRRSSTSTTSGSSSCGTAEIFIEEVVNPRFPTTPDFHFPPHPHAQLSSVEHRIRSTSNNLFSAPPDAHRPSWSPSVQPLPKSQVAPPSAERPDFSGAKKDAQNMEAAEIEFWKRALSQLNGGTELPITPVAAKQEISPTVGSQLVMKQQTNSHILAPAPPPELLPTLVPVAAVPERKSSIKPQVSSPPEKSHTTNHPPSNSNGKHGQRRRSSSKWSDFGPQQLQQQPLVQKPALTPEQKQELTAFAFSRVKPPLLQQTDSAVGQSENVKRASKNEEALTVLINKMDGLTDVLGQHVSRQAPSPSVSYTTTTLDDSTSFVSSISNSKPIRTPAPLPPIDSKDSSILLGGVNNNESNQKNRKKKKKKKKKESAADDLL